MESETTLEKPLSVPGEVTQHLVDAYSATVIRNIFVKVGKYYARQQEGSLDAKLCLNEHELLFIDRYCSTEAADEVHVETAKECVIGKGDKQIKVNLAVLQKMKEKKLMTEVVSPKSENSSSEVQTNVYGEPRTNEPIPLPVVHNTVNKNAYEIRLDVLKEAVKMSDGNSHEALKIAEQFYKFVENKKRL